MLWQNIRLEWPHLSSYHFNPPRSSFLPSIAMRFQSKQAKCRGFLFRPNSDVSSQSDSLVKILALMANRSIYFRSAAARRLQRQTLSFSLTQATPDRVIYPNSFIHPVLLASGRLDFVLASFELAFFEWIERWRPLLLRWRWSRNDYYSQSLHFVTYGASSFCGLSWSVPLRQGWEAGQAGELGAF